MGGKPPKVPPPPPPPPAPKDEADTVNLAYLMAQRASVAGRGFRAAFLGGPRGPDAGVDWQAPETPPPAPPPAAPGGRTTAPTPVAAADRDPPGTGRTQYGGTTIRPGRVPRHRL